MCVYTHLLICKHNKGDGPRWEMLQKYQHLISTISIEEIEFFYQKLPSRFLALCKDRHIVEDLGHAMENNDHDLCNMRDEPPRCETRPFRAD